MRDVARVQTVVTVFGATTRTLRTSPRSYLSAITPNAATVFPVLCAPKFAKQRLFRPNEMATVWCDFSPRLNEPFNDLESFIDRLHYIGDYAVLA